MKDCLSQPSRGVFSPTEYAELAGELNQVAEAKVLDLGCGAGHSIDLFRRLAPSVEWHGVDIADSPEVQARTRKDGAFQTFDGINLPYSDNFFDLIYCNQVLEHVRHPEPLLAEVHRVLKPSGTFVGAVSYLEPYHSFSIFNFTPYGLHSVMRTAGMHVVELRAGSDAFSLIVRQMVGKPRWSSFFLRTSALYTAIDLAGFLTRMSTAEKNFMKIQFCGHLCFKCQRLE